MICKMVKWLISVATWVTGEQRMSVWNFPIAVELPSTPDRDLLKSPTRICFHSHNLHSNSSTMKDLVKELKHGRYLLCISELDQKNRLVVLLLPPTGRSTATGRLQKSVVAIPKINFQSVALRVKEQVVLFRRSWTSLWRNTTWSTVFVISLQARVSSNSNDRFANGARSSETEYEVSFTLAISNNFQLISTCRWVQNGESSATKLLCLQLKLEQYHEISG